MLGLDGAPLSVLSPHDPVVLEVDYTMVRPVEGARLRFAILTEQELVLAGTPNDQAGILPARQGKGQARFVVPSLPFGPGDYLVSIDLTDADFMVTFAQLDRMARLRVRPGQTDVAGLLRLEGSWNHALVEADQPK